MQGGMQKPKIVANISPNGHNGEAVIDSNSISTTILAGQGSGSIIKTIQNYRIRKLTPRECLRLQDFPDTFKQVVSNSQMYKQAGNAMSCNVVEMIFRQIDKALKGCVDNISLFGWVQ